VTIVKYNISIKKDKKRRQIHSAFPNKKVLLYLLKKAVIYINGKKKQYCFTS